MLVAPDIKTESLRDNVTNDRSKGFKTANFWGSSLTADVINDIYNGNRKVPGTGNSSYDAMYFDKEKDDVLTIVVNSYDKMPLWHGDYSGVLGAGVKVAFVIDADLPTPSGSTLKWYGSTHDEDPTKASNSGIFVGNGSFPGNTNFNNLRGMLHLGTSNLSNLSKDIDVDGAFITKGKIESTMSTNITYNNDVINDFYQMGIFKNPDDTDYKVEDMIASEGEDALQSTAIYNVIKPVLLSRY